MKKIAILSTAFIALAAILPSCTPNAPSPDKLYLNEQQVDELTKDGKVYTLNEFKETFMTDTGNYCAVNLYRSRAKISGLNYLLFSIDTLPTDGEGIYVRGRITTDDYGGNFYKSMVIQQIVGGEQQNLRISVDMGSVNGLYEMGQEIIIRCNGLAIGRYANQAQLCIPSYNNNIYANKKEEKVGWAPGRISGPLFRKACSLIGQPDVNQLQYDEITIADYQNLTNVSDLKEYCLYQDGRLVILKDVYFTGQYEYNGSLKDCTVYDPSTSEITGNPSKDGNANVFAPTTNNMGYPQSRVISDGTNTSLVSTSEYAKYAFFYLPDAQYVGTIRGVLGFYEDNGSNVGKHGIDQYNWSITPRGIRLGGEVVPGINDILYDTDWEPVEFGGLNDTKQ